MLVAEIITYLLYPGLVTVLGLGLLYALLLGEGRVYQTGLAGLTGALRNSEGVAALASILLAGLGLALLPWPFRPAPLAPVTWAWGFAALEGAWLIALLPALLTAWPPAARAAIRELQMGVAGRAMLWGVLGVGLVAAASWRPLLLPGLILALLAAFFALPIAIGWGPYAAETSISPGGTEGGLDGSAVTLAVMARMVRSAATLVAVPVALLPAGLLPAWAKLLVVLGLFALAVLLLRRLAGTRPRVTLPQALRRCWMSALPVGVAAIIYLTLAGSL